MVSTPALPVRRRSREGFKLLWTVLRGGEYLISLREGLKIGIDRDVQTVHRNADGLCVAAPVCRQEKAHPVLARRKPQRLVDELEGIVALRYVQDGSLHLRRRLLGLCFPGQLLDESLA